MSEVLAGLIGGLVAIVGAFGVQLVAGAQAERSHRASLIAAFLADADKLYITASMVRVKFRSERTTNLGFETVLQSLDQLRRTGHELAFLCKPAIATTIVAFLEACEDVTLCVSSDITSDEEYDARMIAARRTRRTLHDVLSESYSR